MKVLYCAIYRGFWHTHRELIQREKEGRKKAHRTSSCLENSPQWMGLERGQASVCHTKKRV